MNIPAALAELTAKNGISGHEAEFARYVSDKISLYCDEVYINKTNSVTGVRRASDSAKTIVLTAHLDRIGLAVREVDENGFVSFAALGGVDARILPASEVYIFGREKLFGVIGAKPPHLQSHADSEHGGAVKLDDLLIDTGLGNAARDMIKPGDPILMKSQYRELLGGRVTSAALDNRAGMAAVLYCLEAVRDKKLPYNIKVVFTSGEETGLHGAYTAFDDMPDLAVVVDVTHGSTPDAPKVGTFPLGGGTVICRGPNLHYEITKQVIDLAEKKDIPYKIEVASGSSGTDAWAIQNQKGGAPCVLLSIPLRYMHTTVETLDIFDIEQTGKLLAEIVCGGVDLA